jgi:hypothetical protein
MSRYLKGITAMTESARESPLENVVVFIVFFALILGFCGGVIGVWMIR